jgi:hypothetical protein
MKPEPQAGKRRSSRLQKPIVDKPATSSSANPFEAASNWNVDDQLRHNRWMLYQVSIL